MLQWARIPRSNIRKVSLGRYRELWTAKELADTLSLPKTSLPQRVNYAQVEERFRSIISTDTFVSQGRKDAPVFTIHDGPPFANGDLHIGHALNKMLKDTILRTQLELGFRVAFQPAWDCHGLPIEQKAIRGSQCQAMPPAKLRAMCARFATDAVERQKRDMQAWGLLADFDRPVLTMDPKYEAAQLRLFAKFVERGLVTMEKRPVYWSPSSFTALAEAELEYNDDHRSQTCIVRFPAINNGERMSFPVWTTTPWTLPANQAIAINPLLAYCLVQNPQTGCMVVAKSRIGWLQEQLRMDLEIIRPVSVNELLSCVYSNPLTDNSTHPILMADFVTDDVGTGLVHLAPAYGADDFQVCRANNILEREIVTLDGLFNTNAPLKLQGKDILNEGASAVFELLKTYKMLLMGFPYQHRYPYDWRTQKPVIQMATDQWFISTRDIQDELLQALEQVRILPESGRRRFINMIASRKDWCISRQRLWGVPIPVFYFCDGNTPLMDPEIISHVANVVAIKGSDAWWSLPTVDLLPPSRRSEADRLLKGTNTLDVWFDSGSFWTSQEHCQADVYIEGTDQYRGWFQSSLISSVVATGAAPFKTLIAHGFVLDERGKKMSKSRGNVVAPKDVIRGTSQEYRGIDILRLWAASSNFLQDVTLGSQAISTGMFQCIDGGCRPIGGIQTKAQEYLSVYSRQCQRHQR